MVLAQVGTHLGQVAGLVAPRGQSSPLPTPATLVVSGRDDTHDLGLLPPAMGRWGRVPGSLATGRDPRSAAWLELGRIMCLRDGGVLCQPVSNCPGQCHLSVWDPDPLMLPPGILTLEGCLRGQKEASD